MATGTLADAQSAQAQAADNGFNAPGLQPFVVALYFFFGGITSLDDVVIPKLKSLFVLTNAQAMLVQSAFFTAYLLFSLPAAAIIMRAGYIRTAALGLATMMVGCLLFIPASSLGLFGAFLGALFVLAIGVTVVQVVANPLISLLGSPHTAHSRLTLAQAFNSLGTTVFPYVGSVLILGSLANVDPATLSGAALDAFHSAETTVIARTYLGLAIALAVLALAVWAQRNRLVETPPVKEPVLRWFALLRQPRFALGALCIFLYVGAEVTLGSFIVIFLERHDTLGLGAEAAGKLVPLYWGGAMVGRFAGAALLRLFSPGKVLACAAVLAIALLAIAITRTGTPSGYALLAIGLCNSIMFPTIFSLASEGLGRRTHEGSGIICVAIFGGAVIPPLTGHLADLTDLRPAFLLPMVCYAVIGSFGLYARRPRDATVQAAGRPYDA